MQSRIYKVEKAHVEALMGIPENPPAFAVSAAGVVTSTGWTHPVLAPWMYIVPPKDRILDLDFLASAPSGISLPVLAPITVTQAFHVPRWVKGFRIHSATNAIEAPLDGARQKALEKAGEGMPLPWPFPWWRPELENIDRK
ncbi:hypothetical protein [Rhizobium leguminosarum]